MAITPCANSSFSVYLAGIRVSFHLPAVCSCGFVALFSTRVCAVPTLKLCPDMPARIMRAMVREKVESYLDQNALRVARIAEESEKLLMGEVADLIDYRRAMLSG